MIPREIIELAVQGGWTANHYIEDGKITAMVHAAPFVSLYHNDTKFPDLSFSDIALDPTFWVALCKSIGVTEGEINMCVGCGRAARHSENIPFGKCPKCGDSLYRYDGQWLIEMHRFVDAIAENKVEQFWAGWQDLLAPTQ